MGVARISRALGAAALVAIAAMAAAAPAHATPAHMRAVVADGTTVKIHLTQRPAAPTQLLRTEFGEVNCDRYTATSETSNTFVGMTTDDVTYSAEFFEGSEACEAFGLEAEVDFNGCGYVFQMGSYDGGGMSTGTADIYCPESAEIEIDVSGLCTVSIPAQNGLSNVTYTNGGGTPSDVTMDVELQEIEYSGEGLLCSGSFESGEYVGEMTANAAKLLGGEAVPLEIVST